MKDGSSRTVLFGEAIPGADATAAAEGGRLGSVKFAPIAQLTKPYDEYRSKSLVDVSTADITRVTVARGPNRVVAVRDAARRLAARAAGEGSGVRGVRRPAPRRPRRGPRHGVPRGRPGRPAADRPGAARRPRSSSRRGARSSPGSPSGPRRRTPRGSSSRAATASSWSSTTGRRRASARSSRPSARAKLLPLDTWLVTRVVFESGALRAGAEKLDGTWRSAGREIEGRIADDLLDRLSRAEVRRFVPAKELGDDRARAGSAEEAGPGGIGRGPSREGEGADPGRVLRLAASSRPRSSSPPR